MYQKLAVFLLLFSQSVWCVTPEIHSVTYKSGATFYHFEVELTKGNFLLPKDFPSREQLDDKSENFKYGQFEIFIPASNLELPMGCKTNYIARMPQTLGEGEILIKEKQSLYTTLSDVYQGKIKSVSVVFEMPYKTECNIFFRTSKGKYIDYVGAVR